MLRMIQPNVHCFEDVSTKQKTVKILLMSDLHWDNPKSRHDLIIQDLEEAKRIGARVLLNGDTFCLMQGKYDPRSSKSDIRPEHMVSHYLDAVVETAVDFFKPYAEIIDVVGYGNHETSILRRQETDIVERFVSGLNLIAKPESKVCKGGYGGWYVYRISDGTAKPSSASFKIKYFHGAGGGAPVTKGNIQHNRMSTFVQGADLIWQGHVHNDYETTYRVESLDRNNQVTERDVLMVRTSTYKDEYLKGEKGWHVERGAPPKPLGGRWLNLEYTTNQLTRIDRRKRKIHGVTYRTKS
jgi:hypothetical protein